MSPNLSVMETREPCPICRQEGKDRSGDNLGVYTDGHAYCFAGHGLVRKSDKDTMLQRSMDYLANKEEKKKGVYLPEDADSVIAAKGLQWLKKYGILSDEVRENELLWSNFREALIFPFRDNNGNLLAYQMRMFREHFGTARSQKWVSYGDLKDLTHLVEPKQGSSISPIVVVEDIISAIKVGRHVSAMPLFGSNLSLPKAMRLRFLTKRVIFWLDSDKYKESIKFAKQLNMYGCEAHAIYTPKDPKEYDDAFIKNATRLT